MKPTAHLRFVSRMEITHQSDDGKSSIGRQIKVLQQFFEHSNGPEVVGDMFVTIYGSWKDVPLVEGI